MRDHHRHLEGSACSSVRWALPTPPGPLLQGLGEDEKASSQGGHSPHRAALVQGNLVYLSIYSLEPGTLLQHLSTRWLGGVCFFHRPAQGRAKASSRSALAECLDRFRLTILSPLTPCTQGGAGKPLIASALECLFPSDLHKLTKWTEGRECSRVDRPQSCCTAEDTDLLVFSQPALGTVESVDG